MPAIIEVEYFNTFWLKKIVDNGKKWGSGGASDLDGGGTPFAETSFQPIWPGSDPAGANVCGTNTSLVGGFGLGFYPVPQLGDNPPPTPDEITYGQDQQARCWYVEESRIRGGFNNSSVDLGVKAYITEETPPSFTRTSSLIYSGVFNSKNNFNQTNQFPSGEDISKTADPRYGSIQKLYAEDSNLLMFQENKVSRALIDKDAVYSAEGAPMQTQSNVVIGQITPYVGEYGISRNPESFAVFGFRKYFTDKDRGVVLRLSRDGMTEISSYGMTDYFRDTLGLIPDNKVNYSTTGTVTVGTGNVTNYTISATVAPLVGSNVSINVGGIITAFSGCYVIGVKLVSTGVYDIETSKSVTINGIGDTMIFTSSAIPKIPGGWDIHNRCYTISLQSGSNYFPIPNQNITDAGVLEPPSIGYATLNFDDSINGWVSYYTYNPTFLGSLKDRFYSFYKGQLYQHYSNQATTNNYQTFYGIKSRSSITFIFNPNPSINKNFLTINYEGSGGWEMSAAVSGYQGWQTRMTPNPVYPGNMTGQYVQFQDSTFRSNGISVRSYMMGQYYDTDGDLQSAGFALKENRYVASLINNSETRPGEVIFNPNTFNKSSRNNLTSGIKGFFAIVKMSTDEETDAYGPKELFAVGSVYQLSSQ
jgi:hypothetical protein